MRSIKVFSILAVAGLFSGAWAFDITTSYTYGYTKTASDVGGTVTLDDAVTKVADTDPILDRFTSFLSYSTAYQNAIVNMGTEVSGTWDVSSFKATLYGFDGSQTWKFYGAQLASQLSSTEDITNLRLSWLAAGWGNATDTAYGYNDNDLPFMYKPEDEQFFHGTDANGNNTYSEDTNIGFGYHPWAGGTVADNYWVLAFDASTDASGNPLFTYRGGIHYSDSVVLNPVPEPTTMLLGAGLLALAARRKRR